MIIVILLDQVVQMHFPHIDTTISCMILYILRCWSWVALTVVHY